MAIGTSEALTDGIRVAVRSAYVEERSTPHADRHFFVYHVTIENHSEQAVQLISRHWIITNAHGTTEEVRGLGVVGQQPRLAPGQSFQYTSACPLDTNVGSMRGSYQLVREDGHEFEARIETFTLAAPYALN